MFQSGYGIEYSQKHTSSYLKVNKVHIMMFEQRESGSILWTLQAQINAQKYGNAYILLFLIFVTQPSVFYSWLNVIYFDSSKPKATP